MIQDEILHLLGDRPHVSDEQEVTLSEYSAVRIDVFIDLASSCFDKQANDQLRRMSETTLHNRSSTYLY
jgi:hypothetical protein